MSSTYGNKVITTIFGESHGPAIGAVLDGLPAGEAIDLAELQAIMARRAPGTQPGSTTRKEADKVQVLSGLLNGQTTGSPLALLITNNDQHSASYSALVNTPRPGHADYPLQIKYGGAQDKRGGGHSSGRLTAPLTAAGGICLQILARRGIDITATIVETGNIEAAQAEGDSVGGIIECVATGLPVGLGEPMFGGVENRLAQAIFAIPAVRGIEFGAGFAAAAMRGSQHNDAFYLVDGQVRSKTNNHGGVLGGLTTGMPLVLRVAFKPTPSIAKPQTTVDLAKMQETELIIQGRHDACIVPRALPVLEAVCALTLLDMLI